VTTAQTGLVFLDSQVENGLAAALGGLPRAREALFSERCRFGGRLPVQPAEKSVEKAF
jgi:hypothetical protein